MKEIIKPKQKVSDEDNFLLFIEKMEDDEDVIQEVQGYSSYSEAEKRLIELRRTIWQEKKEDYSVNLYHRQNCEFKNGRWRPLSYYCTIIP